MWRSSVFGLSLGFFRRSLLLPAPLKCGNQQPLGCGLGLKWLDTGSWCNRQATSSPAAFFCTSTGTDQDKNSSGGIGKADAISFAEAKKLLRLVNVEALKRKLGTEEEDVIGYSDLLKACEGMGVARSSDEAAAFAKVLDDAGVILLFRDKVYLHPDKVVDLVRKAVPLALAPEDDLRREELARLQKEKEEIDVLAHRQVRRILWSGLAFFVTQVGLFIRLTFWEFSWDVMEPIAFFGTTSGLVISYAYFLFTSSDPTYQDLMKRLYLSRQRKLFKKQKFDYDRFTELQKHCKSPLETSSSARVRAKLELENDEMLRRELPPGY